MNAKRTMPTRSLLQGMPYVHSTCTDIRARFLAMKAERLAASKPTLQAVAKRSRG